MTITGIYVMSRVRSTGRFACLTLDITCKLFNQFFFIAAMLIGTIDFYHFVPLSLILILPGGHKVNAKQNLLSSFSQTLFIWSRWNLMWWWSHWSWTSREYLWVRLIKIRETSAVLVTASKNFIIWHAFGSLKINLIPTWCGDSIDRYYFTLHFDTSLIIIYLDVHSK